MCLLKVRVFFWAARGARVFLRVCVKEEEEDFFFFFEGVCVCLFLKFFVVLMIFSKFFFLRKVFCV